MSDLATFLSQTSPTAAAQLLARTQVASQTLGGFVKPAAVDPRLVQTLAAAGAGALGGGLMGAYARRKRRPGLGALQGALAGAGALGGAVGAYHLRPQHHPQAAELAAQHAGQPLGLLGIAKRELSGDSSGHVDTNPRAMLKNTLLELHPEQTVLGATVGSGMGALQSLRNDPTAQGTAILKGLSERKGGKGDPAAAAAAEALHERLLTMNTHQVGQHADQLFKQHAKQGYGPWSSTAELKLLQQARLKGGYLPGQAALNARRAGLRAGRYGALGGLATGILTGLLGN